MTEDLNPAVIAEGAFSALREKQRELAGAGIDADIVRPPPQHCSS